MLVEKVSYRVNWKRFKKGYSFFIPCLNPKKARKEILHTVRRLRYQVLFKVVIEEGIRGLRVWRL
jgi:hypothetical protein